MIMPNPYLIVQGEITYVPLFYFIGYFLLLIGSCEIYFKVKANIKLMESLKRIGYLPFISISLFILGSLYATYNLTDISVFYVLFKILSIIEFLVISGLTFIILMVKTSNYIDEDRKRNGYIEEETTSESELSKDANYVTEKEETELREEIKEIKE